MAHIKKVRTSQNETRGVCLKNTNSLDLLTSSEDFFSDIVKKALSTRRIQTYPSVEAYLVSLLSHYMDVRNLFDTEKTDELGRKKPQTLAEMYLVANSLSASERFETLKGLADKSLYISGFFGDSLQDKLVDIDYYIAIGGSAYRILADISREDTSARVYHVFSNQFSDFVETLTYISHSSFIKSNESILRLYDRYLRTGSEIAREKLLEMGVLPVNNLGVTQK